MFSGCPSVRTSRSRDRFISRTDWWITAKLKSCMYLAGPMNWLDFGGHEVKGHRARYVCKIACYRVISRTDWWIPAKLSSCMYLAKPMNWLDFGVTRSKFKGHRAHYVCKIIVIALSQELIGGLPPNLIMHVSCRANEVIRFWGHEVKGHRPHYVCTNSLWSHYHENQ